MGYRLQDIYCQNKETLLQKNMEFMDLPPEILQKIICFLSDEDLCRLRETCSVLRATCDADVVWTTLCSSHYGVQFTPTRNSSARIFYQKTLRAFVRNGLLKVKPHSLWLRIRFYRKVPVKYFRFRSLINNKSLADISLITHLSDLSHPEVIMKNIRLKE